MAATWIATAGTLPQAPAPGPRVVCAATAIDEELDAAAAAAAVATGASAAGGEPLTVAPDELDAALAGADLCIVAARRIDGSATDRAHWESAVRASVAAGVPCVVLGDWIDRETAYRLLRIGARAVVPLGHPRRTSARRKLELIREARIATVRAGV